MFCLVQNDIFFLLVILYTAIDMNENIDTRKFLTQKNFANKINVNYGTLHYMYLLVFS